MSTVYTGRKGGKQLSRDAKPGDVFYVVEDMACKQGEVAPYEDAHCYSEQTVTHDHPILGGAMFGGACSAEALVARYGAVYTTPPKGMRNIADPAPQYAGPNSGSQWGRDLAADATGGRARRVRA